MPEHVTPIRKVHPVVFLVLLLPLGISSGYVTVTLGYLLSQAHVSVAAIAGLVGLSLFPQTWKFVWAPIVDTTLSNKAWFFLSAIVTGVLMAATAMLPTTAQYFVPIEILVVLFSLTSSFNTMAADSLMAHATPLEEKGRAGGWSQAGNLGGTGLGGGAALWLSQHVSGAWIPGAAIGAICVLCSVAVLFLDEPPADHRGASYTTSLMNVLKDVWAIVSARAGALVLVLMLLPTGVGAAQNLWSAVAGDWHASADTVALVTGALAGVISMVGCIAGGVICDMMDRRTAYNVFGAALALCAIGMALAPYTELMFVVYTSLYAFIMGFSYAAFGAVVLEAIGTGAAATKYNVFAGISNLPIIYQTAIDGWAQARWGSNGMLWVEAACGVAAVLFFVLLAAAVRVPLRMALAVEAAE